MRVQEFLETWGYLGIFLGIVLTGVPMVPMPEELPVLVGGALAGTNPEQIKWWIMLPVCIVAVIIGDGLLYSLGRFWGPRLVEYAWVKKRLLPTERLERIKHNFHVHGIKILLFARLTPGIRGPVFFTAGLTRLSMARFVLADGIYAIPGVSLLFFLGYWFAGSIVNLVQQVEHAKNIIVIVVVVAVAGYFLYRFLRKPVVTGDPEDIPPLVEQVTHRIEQVTHNLEQMTTKIIHPKRGKSHKTGPPGEHHVAETTKIQMPPHEESPASPTEATPTMKMPVPPRDGLPQDGQASAHPDTVEKPGT
jgi:membrane protein DedA with SNARE-associated domain